MQRQDPTRTRPPASAGAGPPDTSSSSSSSHDKRSPLARGQACRPGGHSEGPNTRSHPELGRENPQRRWYCTSRCGRVGRRQARIPLSPHRPSRSATDRCDPTDAGWSSPVARQAHNLKVVGSNPTPATILTCSIKSDTRRMSRRLRFAVTVMTCSVRTEPASPEVGFLGLPAAATVRIPARSPRNSTCRKPFLGVRMISLTSERIISAAGARYASCWSAS